MQLLSETKPFNRHVMMPKINQLRSWHCVDQHVPILNGGRAAFLTDKVAY
jgi:hypothetical protein